MHDTTTAPEPVTRSKVMMRVAAFALTLAASLFALQPANAAGELPLYDENDSPNPINATNALIFYKAADLGWIINGEDGVPLEDLSGLAYTVAKGTSYAPSFQLVTTSPAFAYARITYEPYQQDPAQGPNEGTFTDLENGLWWSNKISNPNPGSQADPQPLSHFVTAWPGVKAGAIAIHQGTTTESTSLVTNVTYDGTSIPLGDSDNTPFDQDDIDTAVAARAASHPYSQAELDAAVASYASNHHHLDGAYIGMSRVLLSSTPAAGKFVGITKVGSIASATTLRYQWYLSGKAVPGATGSVYKVPANARGKAVSAQVTGTYKYVRFSVHTNTLAAR